MTMENTKDAIPPFAGAHGSAVLCDMLGCREHATGEVQIGDEYIPLCELHRKAEMDRLTPRWRPLPPHPPNAEKQVKEWRDKCEAGEGIDDQSYCHSQDCGYTVTGRICNCDCAPTIN